MLYDDAVNSGPGVDHLEEFWKQPVQPLDLEGIVTQAYVLDLNRCLIRTGLPQIRINSIQAPTAIADEFAALAGSRDLIRIGGQ